MRVRVVHVALGLLTAGIVGGRIYQVIGQRQDAKRYTPPGILVDAGGHALHLRVMGEAHPGPTVVLETGSGGTSAVWAWIQPETATFARVVSYDRAGLGWSETGPEPRDARRIATELHTALHNANLPEPYIFVGHSYGSHINRVFTAMYPDETAGVVFMDASTAEHVATMPIPVMVGAMGLVRAVTGLGVVRAVDLSGRMLAGLPEASRSEIWRLSAQDKHWQAVQAEVRALPAVKEQVEAAGTLGDRPVIALSVSETDSEQWRAWQASLAALSTRGELRIAPNTDHNGLAMDREQAMHTVEAVRDILAMIDE